MTHICCRRDGSLSCSCFIPRGNKLPPHTHDTPRTGSTDPSSRFGRAWQPMLWATSHLLYNSVDVCESAFDKTQWLISNRLMRRTATVDERRRHSNPAGIRAEEAGRRVAGSGAGQTTVSGHKQHESERHVSGACVRQREIPPVRRERAKTTAAPSLPHGPWSRAALRSHERMWNINLTSVSLQLEKHTHGSTCIRESSTNDIPMRAHKNIVWFQEKKKQCKTQNANSCDDKVWKTCLIIWSVVNTNWQNLDVLLFNINYTHPYWSFEAVIFIFKTYVCNK